MAEPLIGMLKRAAGVVISYWPGLLAWFLVGILGRHVVIQVAGWVGAYHGSAGLALMPFAILSRLIAFVAMLLLASRAVPELRLRSGDMSEQDQPNERFVDAVLAGILPFFAFYAAWQFLRDDMVMYYSRLTEVQDARLLDDLGNTGPVVEVASSELTLTWFTATVIVAVFVARRVIRRNVSKRPRLLSVVAVYLESLWVFLTALIVSNLLGNLTSWVDGRAGVAWLGDLRESIAVHLSAVSSLLTVGAWLLGELGGVVLLPLAWLAIAGTICGEALDPAPPTHPMMGAPRVVGLRQRVTGLPGWLLRRARDLWDLSIDSIRPIGKALTLMWRAGPLIIATYVLVFRSVEWLTGELDVAVTRVSGPHNGSFWASYMSVISLVAPTLTAPLTIGVVAGAFGVIVVRLRHPVAAQPRSTRPPTGFDPPEIPLDASPWPPPTAAP